MYKLCSSLMYRDQRKHHYLRKIRLTMNPYLVLNIKELWVHTSLVFVHQVRVSKCLEQTKPPQDTSPAGRTSSEAEEEMLGLF